MARNCTCNETCNCVIVAGENVQVEGVGTGLNPYTISAEVEPTQILGADTASVDVTIVGAGSAVDPYIVSAVATVALTELTDVEPGAPELGESPTWDGTQWVYATPSVAPGSVSASDGLTGDGSALDPLRVLVSGEYGTSPIVGDQDSGALVYLDSAGLLRAWIGGGALDWDDIANKPSIFPTNWGAVAEKPSTFPADWANVANKPTGLDRQIWTSTAAPTSGQGVDGALWFRYV